MTMQTGAQELKDWIDRRWPLSARKQREAAEYLVWDESFLCAVLAGRRGLNLTRAVQLERLSGIPVEVWLSSDLDTSDEPTSNTAA